MGDRSAIEWTDATWNPVTGCTRLTAGCDNCYAARLAEGRLRRVYLPRRPVVDRAENRRDPFAVRLWPSRLQQPVSWSESRRVFVNSMSDLFHKDIPEEFVRRIFEVMLAADRHIYQVLTKRPARASKFWKRNLDLFEGGPIPDHIWIGSSVENQEVVYRIRHLLQVPAEVRFISCEPLLGPLKLDLEGIHWVIAGGESGPSHRPVDPDWVRNIRDQCAAADVPFFFKQWGGPRAKSGGRQLDGRRWDQYPAMASEKSGNAS